MSEALVLFSKANPDSNKLEASMAALDAAKIDIPTAFKVIFFREKSIDLIRFKQIAELIEFLNVNTGFLAGSPDELAQDLQVVAESTVSSCLVYCGESFLKTENESTMVVHAARIAGELSATESGFPEEMHDDLKLFSKACGFGDPEFADRRDAFDSLRQMRENASYTGVLASFIMNDSCWTACCSISTSNPVRVQDSHSSKRHGI